jgi:H+/Cl- antiporter ClcA
MPASPTHPDPATWSSIMTVPADPMAPLRSSRYVRLLVLAALLGVPISGAAYFYLWLVNRLQGWVFTSLPATLGFHGEPVWWPLLPLPLAGVLVAASLRYLPGSGGHSPADGFHTGAAPSPIELPGVFAASLLTLTLGVVLGPEAPLIALGGGLAVLALRLIQRDAPAQSVLVVGAVGSFAAIAALVGSPLIATFLLMEAIGIGGPTATLVLLPGLLASGVGFLIFLGLDSLTGLGTFSLALPNLPPYAHPNGVQFLWGLGLGLAAGVLGPAIMAGARQVRTWVAPRTFALMPVLGLAVAGLAIAFAEATGKATSNVLFSGQNELPGLVGHSAQFTVGALFLLLVCKGVAYSLSLSSFRGGPIFPALFLGAAGGIAASHLPGMALVPGVAMGIGALSASILRLPLTSVLLATVLLGSDGLATMPLVVITVVVAYVVAVRITPAAPAVEPSPPSQPAPDAPTAAPTPDTPTPAPT